MEVVTKSNTQETEKEGKREREEKKKREKLRKTFWFFVRKGKKIRKYSNGSPCLYILQTWGGDGGRRKWREKCLTLECTKITPFKFK